ncbi:DUF6221 family protein [Amycolatopsis japonica]
MDDLIAFLRARESDREQRAKDWTDAQQPHEEHEIGECPTCDRRRRAIVNMLEHDEIDEPEFVLADVAAKRLIIDEHSDQHECADPHATDYPYKGCRTLRLLALSHADHPSYREEWRP